jgi:hypothetical protein
MLSKLHLFSVQLLQPSVCFVPQTQALTNISLPSSCVNLDFLPADDALMTSDTLADVPEKCCSFKTNNQKGERGIEET